MNKIHFTLLLGTFAFLFSNTAHAEIYKWKDAKGVTHYTATPPPQTAVKNKTKVENIELKILSNAGKYKPSANNQSEKSNNKNGAQDKLTDNKLSPPDKQTISYCKNQRKNLSNLKSNFFNVWVDTDGKRTKLDQKQRQEKVNKLISDIKENCKGV